MFDTVVVGLIVGCVYSYLIYPILLLLIVLARRPAPPQLAEAEAMLSTTLIVAVHNGGGAQVGRKVEEALLLKADRPSLQIIFASDCSTDETDAVLNSYRSRGIEVCRLAQRGGKEAAQAAALAQATGQVIVFSDVAAQVARADFARLISYFNDSRIGGVSSRDRLIAAHGASEEGLYLQYEMAVRSLESRAGGVIGMSGSLFAVRRHLCDPWDTRICSDFNLALNIGRARLRAVSAEDVEARYPSLSSSQAEGARRIRTITRGMAGLSRRLDVLSPRWNALLAFKLWSHKVMRWLVPWFFLVLLLLVAANPTASALASSVLLGQLLLIAAYLCNVAAPGLCAQLRLSPAAFLVESNIAVFRASLRFLEGERVVFWEPSQR